MSTFANSKDLDEMQKISRIVPNRGRFLLIRAQFMLHSAYSSIISIDSVPY